MPPSTQNSMFDKTRREFNVENGQEVNVCACLCTSLCVCTSIYVCVCKQGSACTMTSVLLHQITHSLMLTKLWVEFDAFLAVTQGQTELSQLCITRRPVTEHLRIRWVPLDRLCVMTNRCWVVAYNTSSRTLKT